MVYFFHTCVRCGKVISPERLEVLPETRLCKECSEEMGSDIIIKRREIGMDLDTYKDLLGAIRS
jgi:DNA-directed RNA polymerase subunit RPC12/RpoP